MSITRGHWLGEQVALEVLVCFRDEELKQEFMTNGQEG